MESPVVLYGRHTTSSIEKHRLSKLEEFFSSQYGRSAVSVLVDVEAGRSVYSLGSQSSQRTNYVTPPTRTIPLNQQLVAPLNNKKDRQTRGIEKKPLAPNIPPASSSLHPIINGFRPQNPAANGLLCINCGDFGHRRRECRNPSLPHWEQAYLKEIVFKPISSQSAQSYFYQMLFEDEMSYIEENDPTTSKPQIPFKASYRNFDPHLSDRQDELMSNDNDKITPIEKSMPETFSTSNLIKYQESIVDLLSLLAESAENSRKRVRIDDILNDEHDFQSTSRRSGKEK
ncbi:hypothetical protein GcM3_205028 [Golovinomyces cichoracearum]|uniref:CCHC-type domain-containing protein n=1 Tax=Golovinomyces cichoracearum TaxID=62708 RepID=A0A420HBZ0_9PEZI|nr:hypothetical protein GcM3_205028 [Golovinomyces cichoracearum]